MCRRQLMVSSMRRDVHRRLVCGCPQYATPVRSVMPRAWLRQPALQDEYNRLKCTHLDTATGIFLTSSHDAKSHSCLLDSFVASQDFFGSQMGRDLSTLRCTFNGTPLLLLNSHLESEKSGGDERKRQFSKVRVLKCRCMADTF